MNANDTTAQVDLEAHPNAKKLVTRCAEFFNEVENLTPGKELEEKLNKEYGPGTPVYEDLCTLTRLGLQEGWLANIPIEGTHYRRSKIALPSALTHFFSITSVYMSSIAKFSGQYHAHPYGEINCVVQIDKEAELLGLQGWQGAGWTSPGPGSHHFPSVRGGALVALFFLPAGRIAYDVSPEDVQP